MKQVVRQKQNGSALLLVIGTLAVLCLMSFLMANKYEQNARTVRTPASAAEVNDLVQAIQQAVNNPALCTSAAWFIFVPLSFN